MVITVACSAHPRPARTAAAGAVRGVVALIDARAPATDLFATQFCGGVLVGLRLVLTAAHCVAGRLPATINVVVGADNLCRDRAVGGRRVGVDALAVHPGFSAATFTPDIAALTLSAPASGARAVGPPRPRAGAVAIAYGWGAGTMAGPPACRLQRIAMRIADDRRCVAGLRAPTRHFDAATMLCAEAGGDRNEATCHGDSGGPLLVDGAVVGLVSWGVGCDGGPEAFNRIGAVAGWLDGVEGTGGP